MSLAAAVFSGYLLALLSPLVNRTGSVAAGWLSALLPAALFCYFLSLSAAPGGAVFRVEWIPALGISLSLLADGLGIYFALIVTGIGAVVLVYAGAYLRGHGEPAAFFGLMLAFMASMLGLVLSTNLVCLLVFWELTSITSFLLIGYEYRDGSARAAALQALMVTSGAALFLLAGIVLLGAAGGSYEISELRLAAVDIRGNALYPVFLALIAAGALAKSAQFPFHFWLPDAMQAPTPVSAYLHSATMVIAGVYLFARLDPVLGGTAWWTAALTGPGLISAVLGGVMALAVTDIKRMLAYTTISAIGLMVALLGLSSAPAAKAALVFLLAHALYKGAMFLGAGIVHQATGSRDLTRLRELYRQLPLTAVFLLLACWSMLSLGPLMSFIAKEEMLGAALDSGMPLPFAGTVVVAAAAFASVAIIIAVRLRPARRARDAPPANDAPFAMWGGLAVLALAGLILGLAPGLAEQHLLPAALQSMGRQSGEPLKLWHGFNLPLALSLASVALGLILALFWDVIRGAVGAITPARYSPARLYQGMLALSGRMARYQDRFILQQPLRHYLLMIFMVALILAAVPWLLRSPVVFALDLSDLMLMQIILSLLIVLAVLSACTFRTRMAAVVSLGIAGYGIAGLFLWYSAIDLAVVQVIMETLIMLALLVVFYHMPRPRGRGTAASRLREGLVAGGFGVFITSLLLTLQTVTPARHVADHYAATAPAAGHGRNIVNVILVDFRAFDTLGEVTVLAVAALGVMLLVRLRTERDPGA